MNIVDKVIIAAIKHKDLSALHKIEKKWLDSAEFVRLKYVTDYFKEHTEFIGIRTYAKKYKLEPSEVDSLPSLYLKELKERYIFAEISESIPTLLRKLKDDPKKVLTEMTGIVSALNTENEETTDVRYSDGTDSRMLEYLERVKTKGVSYLSFGNKTMDELFYGIRKTDLITFGGRAGSKKTFLLCYLAIIIEQALDEDKGDILFITNEVPASEIQERIDAIKFKLPYKSFLAGKLSRADYRKYAEGLKTVSSSKLVIIENCLSVEALRAKVNIYQPSIVLLDGSYLMEPTMNKPEWEKITYITRTLKQITNSQKVPILNTTQLKRAGGKSEKGTSFDAQDDFAYSSSYTQDSDVAIRMFAEKDMVYRSEVGLQVAKGRRVETGVTPIFMCNLNTMDLDFFISHEATTEAPSVDF